MFPLVSKDIPVTAAEWVAALTAALRRWVTGSPVIQLEGELPTFGAIDIDLTGTRVDAAAPPDVTPVGPTEPGPSVAALRVVAKPITVRGVPATFHFAATDAAFTIGRNSAGTPIVMLANATEGHLSARIAQAELDAALLQVAQAGAKPHGVDIQSVRSQFTATTPRDLDVALDLTARKIVKFVVRVTGRLSIDDTMTATATNLKVEGSGMAAGFAAGMLRSQLKKLEGQRLPLLRFSLGAVRLRDVAVDTANGLSIRATFGTSRQ